MSYTKVKGVIVTVGIVLAYIFLILLLTVSIIVWKIVHFPSFIVFAIIFLIIAIIIISIDTYNQVTKRSV